VAKELHCFGRWLKRGDRVCEINLRDSADYKDGQAVSRLPSAAAFSRLIYCVNEPRRQGVPVTSIISRMEILKCFR
jgi:hypothetical protein